MFEYRILLVLVIFSYIALCADSNNKTHTKSKSDWHDYFDKTQQISETTICAKNNLINVAPYKAETCKTYHMQEAASSFIAELYLFTEIKPSFSLNITANTLLVETINSESLLAGLLMDCKNKLGNLALHKFILYITLRKPRKTVNICFKRTTNETQTLGIKGLTITPNTISKIENLDTAEVLKEVIESETESSKNNSFLIAILLLSGLALLLILIIGRRRKQPGITLETRPLNPRDSGQPPRKKEPFHIPIKIEELEFDLIQSPKKVEKKKGSKSDPFHSAQPIGTTIMAQEKVENPRSRSPGH
jgi:hypothetical protein